MKKKARFWVLIASALLIGACAALVWRETVPSDRFAVYGRNEAPATLSPAPAATLDVEKGRININRAAEEELQDLPGVGPALAGRIIAYRDEHGPFTAPEDLLEISGIGEKVLEGLLPYVAVE